MLWCNTSNTYRIKLQVIFKIPSLVSKLFNNRNRVMETYHKLQKKLISTVLFLISEVLIQEVLAKALFYLSKFKTWQEEVHWFDSLSTRIFVEFKSPWLNQFQRLSIQDCQIIFMQLDESINIHNYLSNSFKFWRKNAQLILHLQNILQADCLLDPPC